ncbi:LysR family transcriptional regulator [Lacticaseibacillus rhamnosus]|uniref:LysR family transcriptional regulator n=1 Tax=Lacticaseibacillus rhamnosus TaxID=47715 RepID=UPI000532F32C|nr:LysR family transcriptional regulator [Lacticaseibacillus rhamnosus]
MRLLQLNYFLNVAVTQNISRSARTLNVSQPSLSRSIHELEAELGVPLFTRNGHSLALNDAGRRFAAQVRAGLNEVNHAVRDLHRFSEINSNQVTLRFESSTAVLPGLLGKLDEKLPTVKIHLMQNGFEQDRLSHYDFEFTTKPIFNNRNFHLLKEEILVRFPKTYDNANNKEVRPEELVKWPLILTESNPLREQMTSMLHQAGVTVRPSFVTGDRQTILGLVRTGQGICFMPQYSWAGTDVSGTVGYHFAPERVFRDIYLSASEATMKLPYRREIAETIQQYFADLVAG